MGITEDAVRSICTDAVLERGERCREEGRIHRIHHISTTVTAVVSGSRQYDVHVDPATNGFAPRCGCSYDGPGTCKHVVAMLPRYVGGPPQDEGGRFGTALNGADTDEPHVFLHEELVTDASLRDQSLVRISESTTRSVDELRTTIDRWFEETNPEYYVVFGSISFTRWLDLATEYCEQERYASVATVYRALVESLDDNMEYVGGAYDHFLRVFSRALDGYVNCTAFRGRDNMVTDAVAFLDGWAMSETSFLTEHLEKAVVEFQEKTNE